MSETGIVVIDGQEVVVKIKQVAYVSVPSIPSIPNLQIRLEALLVGGSRKGVESTVPLSDGGVMVTVRPNSSAEVSKHACHILSDLLSQ